MTLLLQNYQTPWLLRNLLSMIRHVSRTSLRHHRTGLKTNRNCPAGSERIYLTTLPSEIHLKVFDYLNDDPEASTCLGLTCRKLSPLFARHAKAKLYRICEGCKRLLGIFGGERLNPRCYSCEDLDSVRSKLYGLLRDWMGPKLQFSVYCTKYLTPQRALEVQREIYGAAKFGDDEQLCCEKSLLRLDDYRYSTCVVVAENNCLDAS
jgi:hypothetical protein